MDLKRRKVEYVEKTVAVKDEYKRLLEKEEKITQLKERLKESFYSHWKNLEPTGEYKVSAFTVNNKGKYTYVGVLAEKDGVKNVYYLKDYHKNMFINAYNSREDLRRDGYVIIPYNNGTDLVCLPTEEPFITFTTNGVTTYQSHTIAKIEKLKFYTDMWVNVDIPFTQEDMDPIIDPIMEEIKGHF